MIWGRLGLTIAASVTVFVISGCAPHGSEPVGQQAQADEGDDQGDGHGQTTGPCFDADFWDKETFPISGVETTSTGSVRWQTFLIISTDPKTGATSGRNALLRLPTALAPGDTTASFIQQDDAIWTRENAPPNNFNNPAHNAPGPQGVFLFVQVGQLCMVTSDGKQHLITPNRMVWAADTTGLGHITRTVNGRPTLYANARLNTTAVVRYKECAAQYPGCVHGDDNGDEDGRSDTQNGLEHGD